MENKIGVKANGYLALPYKQKGRRAKLPEFP
jgi:hypothetical protein